MKRLTYIAGILALFSSQVLMANTLHMSSFSEADSSDVDGILDTEFGLDNLIRIDDEFDQYWNVTGETASISVVGKTSRHSQKFGFINDSDSFTPLINVPYANGKIVPAVKPASLLAEDTGSAFRFAINPKGIPMFGKLLFSSDPEDNVFCSKFSCSSAMDHMITWLISDGEYAGDYVIAWEDSILLGDRDYNDLVLRVSGAAPVSAVPVPAALWLFGSGLIGLAAVARRRD